jgi:hypothetical protein
MVFRYTYSQPNVIRSFFPTSLYQGKEEQVMVGKNTHTGEFRSFKLSGIHFETQDLLPAKYTSVFEDITISPITPVEEHRFDFNIETDLNDILTPIADHSVNYVECVTIDILNSTDDNLSIHCEQCDRSLEDIHVDTMELPEVALDIAPSTNTSFTREPLYINTNVDEILANLDLSVPNTPRPTEITCQGCLEDQPNQLAHMDYGGCLYTPW